MFTDLKNNRFQKKLIVQNTIYESPPQLSISRQKPLSLVSEFFDLIFILNFVYASQFVFYVMVYTKTIRQLGLVVYEQIVDSGFTLVDYLLIDNEAELSNC